MAGIDAARFRRPPAVVAEGSPGGKYGDEAYWAGRYAAEGGKDSYDWYLKWEQLKDAMGPILSAPSNAPSPAPDGAESAAPSSDDSSKKQAEILILGCGTSSLGEQLYAEGFVNITNVDRCQELVDAMREKHQDSLSGAVAANAKGKKPAGKDPKAAASPDPGAEAKKPMEFVAADVRELPQEWSQRFDVVIDKALLDAIACAPDKWSGIEAMMQSISRVLKPHGVYLCVSHACPEMRQMALLGPAYQRGSVYSELYKWALEHRTLPRLLINPNADPKAKEKHEITPSPMYKAENDLYHLYICRMQGP